MGGGERGPGGDPGGIAGLARTLRLYGSEFERDVMVQTGRTLEEYIAMGAPGVVALAHYNAHMGLDTATFRSAQGLKDGMEWSSSFKQAALLADLYDLVAVLNTNVAHMNSKRRHG